MIELDPELDKDPNDNNIGQMVGADARNRLAFVELEHYQEHHTFKGDHPIVSRYKLLNELNRLRYSDPDQFMKDLINASKGITRYQSMIKTSKFKDDQERVLWETMIKQFKEKLQIMQDLISSK